MIRIQSTSIRVVAPTEAEVAALVGALKEAMFVLEILRDLGHEFESVLAYTDSQSRYDTVMNHPAAPGFNEISARSDVQTSRARNFC